MPIRPENRGRYPEDWREISERIRFGRAGGRCECTGECGHEHVVEGMVADLGARCAAIHGEPHPVTESRVVLTVAHLDHTPEHCDEANLRAMCQRCHLAYDREEHARSAYYARRCPGTLEMFEEKPA